MMVSSWRASTPAASRTSPSMLRVVRSVCLNINHHVIEPAVGLPGSGPSGPEKIPAALVARHRPQQPDPPALRSHGPSDRGGSDLQPLPQIAGGAAGPGAARRAAGVGSPDQRGAAELRGAVAGGDGEVAGGAAATASLTITAGQECRRSLHFSSEIFSRRCTIDLSCSQITKAGKLKQTSTFKHYFGHRLDAQGSQAFAAERPKTVVRSPFRSLLKNSVCPKMGQLPQA